MPRKSHFAGWSKKITSSLRFWNADAVVSESPTSINVLLKWLITPGNYQRWQAGNLKRKWSLCEEIVACLEEEGLTHRSPLSVRAKITALERTFQTTTDWLVAHGHHAALQRGETTKDAQNVLDKMCPYYDELAVVFQSDTCNDDSGTESDEVLHCQSPHLPAATGPAKPLVQDDADSKLELEMHDQRLHDIELECKKTQLEADVICSVALNRKKMLDAGISREEVDRVLPQ